MKRLALALFAPMLAGTAPTFAQNAPAPIQLQHIDVTNVDKSVSPCDNFFQYACNNIIKANPIPADQVMWGTFNKLAMWNQQQMHDILEANKAPGASRTANQQKIGDFYASCVEQADSGKDDRAVLAPLMERIHGMKSKKDLPAVLAAVQMAYGQIWAANDNETPIALFGFGPTPDANNARLVVAGLDQGGLSLPSRDFYLKDDAKTVGIRKAYTDYLEKMLAMDGMSPEAAKSGAASALAFETALAKAQMDNVTRRDPNKTNNRFTPAQLKTLMPNFDWNAYFAALGAPSAPLYEVGSPEFFHAVNGMIESESLATWKIYLTTQLLHAANPVLGNQWRDANFELMKTISGAKQQPPTWRRCSVATDKYLGEALGEVYVSKAFSASSKERVLKMVKEIEAAMGRDIDSVSWMQPETKQQAHLKLAAVVNKIGYPDKWIDYTSYKVTRESYAMNVSRGTKFEFARQLGFINKPLDRMQWGMTPPTVNAYEDPQTNTINFPAGILQPPMFDPAADDVLNYGAEGAVIGHELTHNFDDQGRKFDLNGDLKDWWTPADAKAYEERGECIANEYSGPAPGVEGVQQNGKLTQGENTADNGGLNLSLSALTADLLTQGRTLDDKDANGLTNLQRFFVAFANDWCGSARPEISRMIVMTNPHSLAELRVNNTVGNMPAFAKAFGCKTGQPMVHKPACKVW
ncbi:M13 family metallopeptidase [Granulicella cerasi]|uniref:M13 family metallopeptidase n=1 Tax=Granulicella cerasi TaxID=741063 RepID=A0ABW1ZAM8_9BACT|nr:M13 family metallopeptidase [Granulicella cerasi]